VNELRGLPAFLHDGSPGTIDARTLDLAAMMFDAMFADRHLPTAMKAQLGRLQLPILRRCCSTRSSSPNAASRRAGSSTRSATSDSGSRATRSPRAPAMDLVRDVVHGHPRDFETDMVLFASMAAMVETFVAANEEADAHLVQRASFLVEARRAARLPALAAGVAEVARRLQARTFVPARYARC
jgi:hypothetical protein